MVEYIINNCGLISEQKSVGASKEFLFDLLAHELEPGEILVVDLLQLATGLLSIEVRANGVSETGLAGTRHDAVELPHEWPEFGRVPLQHKHDIAHFGLGPQSCN